MISGAILYDLAGAKEWARIQFTKEHFPEEVPEEVISRFFDLILQDDMESCVTIQVSGISFCLARVDEKTLLLTYTSDEKPEVDDVDRTVELRDYLADLLMAESPRDASKRWHSIAGKVLRKNIRIRFAMPSFILNNTKPGSGVQRIMQICGDGYEDRESLVVGPFEISSSFSQISELADDSSYLTSPTDDVILTIVKRGIFTDNMIQQLEDIKENVSIPVLVVPASDEDLEFTRSLENRGFRLCDSITEDPIDLTLAILAMMGESHMQPELARKKWVINKLEAFVEESGPDDEKEGFGHKAFFVVTRENGEAVFSYYYDVSSEFLERSPNVIAAITMFEFDTEEDSRTSVFRTGELVYAVIEHEDLIFALITGQDEDIADLRRRFSFLPELWREEDPENLRCDSQPYHSPPFALKLLATLPPEKLPMRYYPVRKKEPDWVTFRYPEVRDLLQAVWQAIEKPIIVEQFAASEGPNMTLGAIHLLRILEAIDFRVKIALDDRPVFVEELDDQTKQIYSHIEQIRNHTDGNKTIKAIGEAVGIAPAILLRVFQDLHRRGLVHFRNADMSSENS
ncbi:hypothetical protein EU537_09845 [Candidatus Thorarchaeota archaeon]|nr:MAG: hypothetical protein EU537_09845 [Candidatus Thorarchaeota archaeon]